jgi:hypothetical protein
MPDCREDEESIRVAFGSAEEAERAGYRKAGDCK